MANDINSIFNQLYSDYAEDIYRYALSRLKCDTHYADDCVQDTFLILYQKIKAGETFDNPRAFLYKCATNFIKKRFEAQTKENRRLASLEDYENTLSFEEEQAIITRLDFQAFTEKLNEILNDEEKELYLLRFEQGKKISEIAQILGIKSHTATMRISRLRTKIIFSLNEYSGKED